MLFIVINHFLEPHDTITHAIQEPLGETLRMCVMAAVNTFILISGYFGIKLKLRSIFNLYLLCAFYGLIGYFVHIFTSNSHIGFSLFDNSLFIFSHNTWWYISGYLYLLLLSPMLNAAIHSMNQKQHLFALTLMGIATCYFGWFHNTDLFNHDGFCLDQFLILYMIGAYMHKYHDTTYYNSHRYQHILLFLSATFIYILHDSYHLLSTLLPRCYLYNSPFCILASVGLLGYFLSLHFKSAFINYLAASALAAYLLQDQQYLGQQFIYPLANTFYTWLEINYPSHINITEPILALGVSFIFLIAAIILDKIREFLMFPIWTGYDWFIKKHPTLDKHISV